MAKRMRTIVEEAQKRRALYLRQYNKLSISIAEFAEMNQITPARMGQLLNKAKDEQAANS
jgi:hypothetical protein